MSFKKSKKWWGAVIASVLVFLGGGSALAYVYVKNTPDMILRDAFYNTTKQTEGSYKATLAYDSEQDFSLAASGAWNQTHFTSDLEASGTDLKRPLKAHMVYAKDKFFLKIDDLRTILKDNYPDYQDMVQYYDRFISLVDTKWIVITEQDLEDYFGLKKDDTDKKRSECIDQAIADYRTSKSQQKEVYDAYRAHQFVTFTKLEDEPVENKAAYRFSVVTDIKEANAFVKQVQTSALYKNLKTCISTESDELDDSPFDESTMEEKTPTVQLWVDKASRTLRKVQVVADNTSEYSTGKDIATFSSVFDFTKTVTITEPQADTTFKQLQDEVEKMMSGPTPSVDTTVLGARDFRWLGHR
jgi:hypothetical protein